MRPRVTQRLEQAAKFPVTLIVAPAGFGKSVALRDYLAAANIQAVRYDVRREDATLIAFVRGLAQALEPIAPTALAAFPAMQERILAADEPVRQLSDWFAEHLKDIRGTIVIDDLHFAAADPASIALIADLIERTTDRIRWITAARSDVGLPIATWIAYGRMDIPVGEDDLRFTTDEAIAASEELQSGIGMQEIESLRQLTEGWPVALAIALRTRTHATDLRSAALGAREMVFRYLAEQIFVRLSLPQRAFALSTCVLPFFDATLSQELGATAGFVAEFRSKVTFLNEVEDGRLRYHDLFRDFLEMELRRSGENEWARTLCAGAALLERHGHGAEALLLYARARSSEDVIRILEREGFALFERGETARLSQALESLSARDTAASAMAQGLRAMIDASLGRFEIAEQGFIGAIRAASDDAVRLRLVHRYALELVRLDRDCTELLEPYAAMQDAKPQLVAPILATLATGYRRNGRKAEALSAAERSLALLDAELPDDARARIFQQAAYVQRYAGSLERARAYASTAIDLALQNDLYELAARAYSVTYTIVRETSDSPAAGLDILERINECALKGGSTQARVFALAAIYTISAEKGDEDRLKQLDRDIEELRVPPQWQTQAILPARALREAWRGHFDAAYAMLAQTAQTQTTPDRRALRAAEAALYAAAAGESLAADTELAQVADALSGERQYGKDAIRGMLIAALALLLRGQDAASHRYITQSERALTGAMHHLRIFAHAVRTAYRVKLEQAAPAEIETAYGRLRESDLAGLGLLLQRLPAPTGVSEYASLTGAEREILQMLAEGGSTKDISRRSGRSPHTIDTHIRSICRKLECSGRREAVALATRKGWVQT